MKEKIMEKWSEENRKKSNKRVGENWTDVSWLLCGGVCVCVLVLYLPSARPHVCLIDKANKRADQS